jgi:hypothetical protein
MIRTALRGLVPVACAAVLLTACTPDTPAATGQTAAGQGTTSTAAGAPTAGATASGTTDATTPGASPSATTGATSSTTPPVAAFRLTSPVFGDQESIPDRYTCQGSNVSPPLAWTGAPAGTTGFAIVVTDPDASGFVHWVIGPIPATTTSLAEGASSTTTVPQGSNDFGSTGWSGPCPPNGVHRYRFRAYALSGALSGALTAARVEAADALAVAELDVTYERP